MTTASRMSLPTARTGPSCFLQKLRHWSGLDLDSGDLRGCLLIFLRVEVQDCRNHVVAHARNISQFSSVHEEGRRAGDPR